MSRNGLVANTTLGARWAMLSTFILVGCGGGMNGNGNGSGGTDGGADDAGAGGSACEHYYAAQYSRCSGPVPPGNEVSRVETRFVQVCLSDMDLPGSGMTPASVEACASALDSSPCELPDGPPLKCRFTGSLAGGSACNEGLQCQNGRCGGTAVYSPGGQVGPFTCGTCAPFVAVGQVCAHDNFSGGCGDNAICLIGAGMETVPDPTYTCVATTQGDVGAACDDLSAICKTGLYCAALTGRCMALGDTGAACGVGAAPPGNPGGCAAPLSCVGPPGLATCSTTGGAGGFCLGDLDCSPGLGCVPGPCSATIARIGCSASGTCQPVAWASPGQACDGYRTRCLVAECSGAGLGNLLIPPTDGGVATGTCPMVASDGQSCNAQCDTFAECFSPGGEAGSPGGVGTCTLLDSVVCR